MKEDDEKWSYLCNEEIHARDIEMHNGGYYPSDNRPEERENMASTAPSLIDLGVL